MKLSEAKRISVIGNSGAGKSTLSERLGKSLGIEVFFIDKIYWLAGWKLRDHVSYKKLHKKWLETDFWIIDGLGHWGEMVRRLSVSDIVIFLDVSVKVCKERAEIRIKEEKSTSNPYITPGCIYQNVKDRQMELIDHFHSELRPEIFNVLSNLDRVRVEIISKYSELIMDREI